LPGPCSDYELFEDFSFMVSFVGDSNYLVVPLAFFVRDIDIRS